MLSNPFSLSFEGCNICMKKVKLKRKEESQKYPRTNPGSRSAKKFYYMHNERTIVRGGSFLICVVAVNILGTDFIFLGLLLWLLLYYMSEWESYHIKCFEEDGFALRLIKLNCYSLCSVHQNLIASLQDNYIFS